MFPDRRAFLCWIISANTTVSGALRPTNTLSRVTDTCPSCKGKGRLHYGDGTVHICSPCSGSGIVSLKLCPKCKVLRPLFQLDTPSKLCWNCDVVIPGG